MDEKLTGSHTERGQKTCKGCLLKYQMFFLLFLLLHDGAENMLKRLGSNPKTVDIEKIRSEYNAISTKKKSLQKTYQSAKNDCDSLQKNLDNLQQYLDQPSDEKRNNKSIIQSRNTL